MSDLIRRLDAIDALDGITVVGGRNTAVRMTRYIEAVRDRLKRLPSAQPEISRIEQELHGKTPEEQYEFLYWLLLKFGLAYTDSRLAVIEWLRGER